MIAIHRQSDGAAAYSVTFGTPAADAPGTASCIGLRSGQGIRSSGAGTDQEIRMSLVRLLAMATLGVTLTAGM
ncbi:MAG TPA: hypothetical protein VLK61_15350, partial [Aquabacterium sp.]|nr:hypothetical protein [Aquabacterium sp.]